MSERIIAAFAPTVPMWAIFLNEDGKLKTSPIIAICVMENEDGTTYLHPYDFSADGYYVAPHEANHFVGYSVELPVKPEEWETEIRVAKRKSKWVDPNCPVCGGDGWEFYEENGENLVRDCPCLSS